MGMTFLEQIAAVALGMIPGDQLPEVATVGIIEGYDCSSLAALAGQSSIVYDSWEFRGLWRRSLQEMGLSIPAPLEAAKTLVRMYARLVAVGELTPRVGGAKIVQVHQEVHQWTEDEVYVGDSIGASCIIGLYYQHDDCGFLDEVTHQKIDCEILEKCRNIISNPAV
ncbi:MAG: hypothetical protein ABI618_04680 [Nitrospirota bacterium]